jgi:alpha-mannosidase
VTLVRSVEWLSRDDFPTRRSQNAGPTIMTDEAQCDSDPVVAHLALVPFSGDWRDAGIRRLSERWRRPPLVIQGVEDNEKRAPGDFLTVDDPLVSVTAIKRHEDRDTLIVRMFNDSPEARDAVVRLGPAVSTAWRVDLIERRQSELAVNGGHDVIVPLRKHGIATVEIAF